MDLNRIEQSFQCSSDHKCSSATGGMVATAFPDATRAGVQMLERGGNAVDAACAAALALGVCEPQGSGLGGQTMALLRIDGRTIAVDGSSHAPALAHRSRLRSRRSRELGYTATTIPTTLAVLGHLNRSYGRLEWSTLFEPAVRIAENGYRITPLQSGLQEREKSGFLRVPSRAGARYFLKNGTTPYPSGENFVQKDLAATLSQVASDGFEAFYRGHIGQRIDADMKEHRGLLRAEDLALLPEVIEREALADTYRGLTVHTFPPPGAGHTLLLILKMMERFPARRLSDGTPEAYRLLAEIQRLALVENRSDPLNPHTFHQLQPWTEHTRRRAHSLAASIDEGPSPRGQSLASGDDPGETTHLSVMDGAGNVAAITQSVNLVYGSKAAADGLGFLYNDYVEAFQYDKPTHYYNLRPSGIPWSSVAPALVSVGGKPWLVAGSPGSQRGFSATALFLSGVIDGELPISHAMSKARFYAKVDGEISIEGGRVDPTVLTHLAQAGYRIRRRDDYSFFLGAIHAVLKCRTKDGYQGVADVRRDGTAEGLP